MSGTGWSPCSLSCGPASARRTAVTASARPGFSRSLRISRRSRIQCCSLLSGSTEATLIEVEPFAEIRRPPRLGRGCEIHRANASRIACSLERRRLARSAWNCQWRSAGSRIVVLTITLRIDIRWVRPPVKISLLFHFVEESITALRHPSGFSPFPRGRSVLQPEQNRYHTGYVFCCFIRFLSVVQDFCSEIRTSRGGGWSGRPILVAIGLVDLDATEKRPLPAPRGISNSSFAGKTQELCAVLPFCRFAACKRRPFTVKR